MTDPALPIATTIIAGFEGFRSAPYEDAGRGVWTIGFGFTILPSGARVCATTPPITREDAKARLSSQVERILSLVRGMIAVPLSNNAAAALCSFAFNLGTNALRNSTLLHLFNAGETAEAAKQFGAWVYAGGHVIQGLVGRRKDEAALFLTPDTIDVSEPIQTADELMNQYNPEVPT